MLNLFKLGADIVLLFFFRNPRFVYPELSSALLIITVADTT